MPLNIDYLRGLAFPSQETTLTDRDAMFYALSIGLGHDPLDRHDLPYVYERDLRTFPTMPLVVGHPGRWMSDPATGITYAQVVHGGQRLWTYRDLPIGKTIVSRNRIADVLDKGNKGAIIVIRRDTVDGEDGTLLAEAESTLFCRADGGFGGLAGPGYAYRPLPDRSADRTVQLGIGANAALLYRLNHDRNPLHADPDAARDAGFARPVLHGLAPLAMAAVGLGEAGRGSNTAIEARFSSPVMPGETIDIDIWKEAGGVAFRARIAARSSVALDRGWIAQQEDMQS